jgi:hypothetical protein
MAADQQYLTREGAAELRAELQDLLTVRRPALAEQLKEAIGRATFRRTRITTTPKSSRRFWRDVSCTSRRCCTAR